MKALRASLAFRLYGLGLLQLLVLGLATAAIGMISLRPPRHEHTDRLALEAAAARIARAAGSPALQAQLRDLKRQFGLAITLYDARSQRVASSIDPPLKLTNEPPRPRRGPPLFFPFAAPPEPPIMRTSVALATGEVQLLAQREHMPSSQAATILTLLSGLLIVGLGAASTARWIVRPLQQLSAAARQLGAGNLEARSGLKRRDEVGELSTAFDDMAARLRALLLAEKELLANVSHELKTPLARIRVALDLANEGDAAAARLSLEEIALDLSELESLVNDILVAARMALQEPSAGAHAFALHREEVSAEQVASDARARFLARHPSRDVVLELAGDEHKVSVDRPLFRRVLDNLLENAHKYTEDAGSPITVRVHRDGAQVRFEVEDRGVGISTADLSHVFEPFFRAERSRSRKAGGVGLGLTLVSRIVSAHGGRVALESREGKGTCARVWLDLA